MGPRCGSDTDAQLESHPPTRYQGSIHRHLGSGSAPLGVKWLAFIWGPVDTFSYLLAGGVIRGVLIPAVTRFDCLFVLDNGRGADLLRTTSAGIHVELTGARPY